MVKPREVMKNDSHLYEEFLHLNCIFNPIGNQKCLIYKDGFVNDDDCCMRF